jgi:hypothetical protein
VRCAAKGCDRAPEIFQWCAVHAPAVEWIQKVADLRAALAQAEAERKAALETQAWCDERRANAEAALRAAEADRYAYATAVADLNGEALKTEAELAEAQREAAKFQAMSEADIAERRAADRTLEAERGVVVACTRRAEASEARAQRAVEVLRDVEWSDNSGGEYAPCCPACGWVTNDAGKHRPDCALAAVLKEGK